MTTDERPGSVTRFYRNQNRRLRFRNRRLVANVNRLNDEVRRLSKRRRVELIINIPDTTIEQMEHLRRTCNIGTILLSRFKKFEIIDIINRVVYEYDGKRCRVVR
jgi:hypothetical protein